ncbi:hypothetical protein ACW9HC_32390 [Nocardia gipuzkoensis]
MEEALTGKYSPGVRNKSASIGALRNSATPHARTPGGGDPGSFGRHYYLGHLGHSEYETLWLDTQPTCESRLSANETATAREILAQF